LVGGETLLECEEVFGGNSVGFDDDLSPAVFTGGFRGQHKEIFFEE